MPRSWMPFLVPAVFLILSFLCFLNLLTKRGDHDWFSLHVTHSGIQNQSAFTYHIVPQENLTLITEPDDGMQPILSSIEAASSSIDMVMYELEDVNVESALAAAAGRGVSVRVLLNSGLYGKSASVNQIAFSYLQSHNVQVKWSPSSFALTHQKTLITDSRKAIIMTFNLTPAYYATARDFGIIDSDVKDVSAIENIFANDWNSSDEFQESGDDLVWSPGSKQILLDMITSAHSSLEVTSEEIQDADIIDALAAACGRGVKVQLLMTDNSQWHQAFAYLTSAGVSVRTYPKRKKVLYIHEKIIIADGVQAFIGSQNLTSNSLNENRELGILVSTPNIVQSIAQTFATDWNSAQPE